ncbi:MAG: alpha-glucosidase/alpha-galactosidase [Anaerolineaceae bacterium]|nr:alpha-glucosidase/alpha-galactosidase [Anaerolineaceae bacterium]
MIKITFIGAGSTVFAKNLLADILNLKELVGSAITLFDIDEKRLRETEALAHIVAQQLNVQPRIETTTDRRKALDGADYAINMIQVGGYEPSTRIDFEIPKKYGLRQTIGDTSGIGGIMRALRTIPVMLEMSREMEELCPDVLHLSYVNPMAINTWALYRGSSIKTVGLCHSVPQTAGDLALDLDIPVEEISYLVAGINHMAFYLKLERNGEDLYPQLQQVMKDGRMPAHNLVRYEMLKRLGYFVTESSEHFSEYVPWFIKRDRPDLLERYNIPIDEYLYRCQAQIRAWNLAQARRSADESLTEKEVFAEISDIPIMPTAATFSARTYANLERLELSGEFGALIIHSIETGQPRVIYGNVENEGLIDNLPQGCCVEVPCLVDNNGVQPTHIGELPPHLAALMQTQINVQKMTVEAALTQRRDHIYHAAMLDPHTAAELDLDQIWSLVDELISAHGDCLPAYH